MPDSHPRKSAPRVLLAGFSPSVAERLTGALRSTRVGAEHVSGEEHMWSALDRGGFGAALIDVDGLENAAVCLSSIRRRHPELRVAVAAESPSPDLVICFLHNGIREFCPKPLQVAGVAASLRSLVEEASLADARGEIFEGLRSRSSTLDRSQRRLAREIVRANQQLQSLNSTLKKHVSHLTILYQMGRDISENENWSDALDRFLMALVNYIGAEGAALLLFSDHRTQLRVRANFHVDPAMLAQSCQVVLEGWSRNPRGLEIHAIESYRESMFGSCLERTAPWRHTILPLRHRNRALGFLLIEKDYASSISFTADYPFLNTIETILAEEVANASYISELRQLSRFNQKVLDTINSGVVATDLAGNIRFFNERAVGMCAALGNSTAAHFDDLFHHEASGRSLYGAIMNSHEMTHVLEAEYSGEGDGRRPARLSIAKMHDDNLNGTVLVAAFDDLSEQKRLETEVRRNDRLRVLGQLSAGVAHEIRNPLTGIATSAEVLKGKVAGDEGKVKYIRVILDEIHRLDDIIRGLLNFARPSKPRFAACSIGDICARVQGLLVEEAAKKRVRLETVNRLTRDECRGDANQLTQVLLNIVLNAIQASDAGDTVQVVLAEGTPSGEEEPCVRIDVQDSGRGVPKEVRSSLFDPFVTTKTQGTGLGLAVSQKIIEEHHGEIKCDFLERGTRFSVRLPRHVEGAEAAEGNQ